MSAPRISLAVVLLSLFLAGCWNNDYAIALPNGYSLVRGNDREIFIANDKGFVLLYGKILSYAALNEFVVGEVTTPDSMADFQKKETAPAGYFIFDTKQNHAVTGLSRQGWESELQKLGKKTPTLIKPECPRNALGFCSRS